MKAHIPWLRVFVEGVVIVGSILLAFGLQAWWEGLQDEGRAQDHLLALQGEFVANLDSLNGNITRLEEIKGAAAELLAIIVGEEGRPSADSLAGLTWNAFSFPPYEPFTVAYDNLIGSGDIALLRDGQLNADLALFMSQVEHYRRGELQMDQWKRVIQQFVTTEMSPLDWLSRDYRANNDLPEPARSTDWDDLLQSREFEGILVNRIIGASDNLMILNRVVPPAERIVTRLHTLLQGTY